MKLSSILLGLLMLFMGIIFVSDDLNNLKIKDHGTVVYAQIIDMYSSGRSRHMKVRYHDQIISKKIPYDFWESHTVGEIIQVQFLEGKEDILLVDEQVGFRQFFFGLFFVCIALFLFFDRRSGKSLKKSKLDRRKNYFAGRSR